MARLSPTHFSHRFATNIANFSLRTGFSINKHRMSTTHRFSRRAFLRGVGVSMALPWLESFNVWGDEPKRGRPASEAPVRLAVTFSGNGFQSKEWWAKGEGKAMELGKVLAPLAEFRERMLFVRGLFHAEARKGNIHSSQTGNMLSGAPIASGGISALKARLMGIGG